MKRALFITTIFAHSLIASSNQTPDVSPVLVDTPLPFDITISLEDYTLPGGIQSGAAGSCGCEFLFIAGRTNGLHGFDFIGDNFPPRQQNTTVYVVNVHTKKVSSRSLLDPLSGLTQQQIDSLSVTSPQFYQCKNTLYITGGYGIDTASGTFTTKNTLTAIDIPGLIHWVTNPQCSKKASSYIRQVAHPAFQVTGGIMAQAGDCPTLLMFGQKFTGTNLFTPDAVYTQQVRKFRIIDKGNCLNAIILPPSKTDPNYRRRDLNIVPIVKTCCHNKKQTTAFAALSGVFTLDNGVWTVPVEIDALGQPEMANPNDPDTFKQAMNNYYCAHTVLASKSGSNYILLFGGITYEYYQDGAFQPDPELPFTNQVTIIKRSTSGAYKQYLSNAQFPTIISTFSNPGNTLLFGTGAQFMPTHDVPRYKNGILQLWKIKRPTVIGYIIGGIQSTLPNTFSSSDSAASPYIFKVTLTPRKGS